MLASSIGRFAVTMSNRLLIEKYKTLNLSKEKTARNVGRADEAQMV